MENIGIYTTKDIDINSIIRDTIKEVNTDISLLCDTLIKEAENNSNTLEEYKAFMKGAAFVFKCVAKRNDPNRYGTPETLEIEKQPKFKDGDIICVTDGNEPPTYIVIYKKQEDNHIYRYATVVKDKCIGMNEGGYLCCAKNSFKRYATDLEKQQLFDALAKEGKTWDVVKKQIVDLKPKWNPKPFDRVVTRVDDDAIWTANIFSHIDSYGEYNTIGCVGGYPYCLPYNEETAKLIGTTKEWKE